MTTKITTETGKEMLESVTPIYNKDDLALAIFEANGRVMDEIGTLIKGLKYELFPQNATWTLTYWEQKLGINHRKKLTTAERVQVVLFELNKYFSVTKSQMEIIVNAFVENQNAYIEEIDGEYAFQIIIPVNNKVNDGIWEGVEDTKPAHLLAIFERVSDFGAIVIKDDSYHYPVFYPLTGKFWGKKDFTQLDISSVIVTSDDYEYPVIYPVNTVAVEQFNQEALSVVDDTYGYPKDFRLTGEMMPLTKGVETSSFPTTKVSDSFYDYPQLFRLCGQFAVEKE